jgi:hypothetical protein
LNGFHCEATYINNKRINREWFNMHNLYVWHSCLRPAVPAPAFRAICGTTLHCNC